LSACNLLVQVVLLFAAPPGAGEGGRPLRSLVRRPAMPCHPPAAGLLLGSQHAPRYLTLAAAAAARADMPCVPLCAITCPVRSPPPGGLRAAVPAAAGGRGRHEAEHLGAALHAGGGGLAGATIRGARALEALGRWRRRGAAGRRPDHRGGVTEGGRGRWRLRALAAGAQMRMHRYAQYS
jgi:hypothetical protein